MKIREPCHELKRLCDVQIAFRRDLQEAPAVLARELARFPSTHLALRLEIALVPEENNWPITSFGLNHLDEAR
jgi:hypothetical protein